MREIVVFCVHDVFSTMSLLCRCLIVIFCDIDIVAQVDFISDPIKEKDQSRSKNMMKKRKVRERTVKLMKRANKKTKQLMAVTAGILAVTGVLLMILRSYDKMLSWLFSEDTEEDEELFRDWDV